MSKRGTKYPLPAPKGGRAPDLLLREDQLLTGQWNQRMRKKKAATTKLAEATAGDFLAPRHASSSEVVVGYGRRNPNAMKGRERRGAKKKNKGKN